MGIWHSESKQTRPQQQTLGGTQDAPCWLQSDCNSVSIFVGGAAKIKLILSRNLMPTRCLPATVATKMARKISEAFMVWKTGAYDVKTFNRLHIAAWSVFSALIKSADKT